jgi:hypothetical protein
MGDNAVGKNLIEGKGVFDGIVLQIVPGEADGTGENWIAQHMGLLVFFISRFLAGGKISWIALVISCISAYICPAIANSGITRVVTI